MGQSDLRKPPITVEMNTSALEQLHHQAIGHWHQA